MFFISHTYFFLSLSLRDSNQWITMGCQIPMLSCTCCLERVRYVPALPLEMHCFIQYKEPCSNILWRIYINIIINNLNDDSGLCISSMQKRMLFAGFTAVKKTIIQNWFTPHMCRKTYWIRSLLQIVTRECTMARVGGARPSTIDAWQCFLFNIRDCIRSDFSVFVVLPSPPPFWLDLEMLSMCLLFLFCYILDTMLCYVWKNKKLLITKNIIINKIEYLIILNATLRSKMPDFPCHWTTLFLTVPFLLILPTIHLATDNIRLL